MISSTAITRTTSFTSMIERDNQFETQFILSLIVAVLGVLASKQFGEFTNIFVGGIFLIIGTGHLILLSVHYSFNRVSSFEDNTIRGVEEASKHTLRLTSLAFLYLVIQIATTAFVGVIPAEVWAHWGEPILLGPNQAKTAFILAIPVIPVIVIAEIWRRRIREILQTSRDLSFTVVPHHLRVFHDPSESKALRISVENESEDRTYALRFEMDIPEPLRARYNHEWHSGTIEDVIHLPAESRNSLDFEFKHNSMTRKSLLLRASFFHDDEEHTEEIECSLRV